MIKKDRRTNLALRLVQKVINNVRFRVIALSLLITGTYSGRLTFIVTAIDWIVNHFVQTVSGDDGRSHYDIF
jgi:hypothetical protein